MMNPRTEPAPRNWRTVSAGDRKHGFYHQPRQNDAVPSLDQCLPYQGRDKRSLGCVGWKGMERRCLEHRRPIWEQCLPRAEREGPDGHRGGPEQRVPLFTSLATLAAGDCLDAVKVGET